MKKLINYIKKRPFDTAVWAMIALGLAIAGYFTYIIFLTDDVGVRYGNRLDNIESYPVNETEIVSRMNTHEHVREASVNVTGRIINIIVYTEAVPTMRMSNSIGALAIQAVSEDNRSFYDIQLFIAQLGFDINNTQPIIGYMKAGNDEFGWTNNRGAR